MYCVCIRYLLKQGASLSSVNCDGDVPLDIAEDETMETLLLEHTRKQGESALGERGRNRHRETKRKTERSIMSLSRESPTRTVMPGNERVM